jgi:hypothetical protein
MRITASAMLLLAASGAISARGVSAFSPSSSVVARGLASAAARHQYTRRSITALGAQTQGGGGQKQGQTQQGGEFVALVETKRYGMVCGYCVM